MLLQVELLLDVISQKVPDIIIIISINILDRWSVSYNHYCQDSFHLWSSWPDLLIINLKVGGVDEVLHILRCVNCLKDLLKRPEQRWLDSFFILKRFTSVWFLSELVGQWSLALRSSCHTQFDRKQTRFHCNPQARPVTRIFISRGKTTALACALQTLCNVHA